MLDPPDLCHSAPVWEARKACAPYFAALYGTGDLWCSFDRFNVYQPGQESRSWLHSDQSGLLHGLHCIQVGRVEHQAIPIACVPCATLLSLLLQRKRPKLFSPIFPSPFHRGILISTGRELSIQAFKLQKARIWNMLN